MSIEYKISKNITKNENCDSCFKSYNETEYGVIGYTDGPEPFWICEDCLREAIKEIDRLKN